MYQEEELITLKWTTRNKKYYESLGYNYTKLGDVFNVFAKDLPCDSNEKITVTCDCDGCNNMCSLPKRNYYKSVDKYGFYMCKSCVTKNNIIIRTEKSHERLYNLFIKKCEEHNCKPITTLEDFGGSKSYVKYICPIHGITKTYMSNIVSSDAWCYECGKKNMADKAKLSPEHVKNVVESKNNNILLNPEDYVDSNTKNLIIICGGCNTPYITSYSSVVNGNGSCINCGITSVTDKARSNGNIYYERFKEICKEFGYILLSHLDEYENSSSKLRFVCPIHGEQAVSYAKFSSGQRCPQCGNEIRYNKSRLSPDEVERRINSVNGNKLLNSHDYISNSAINLKIKCSCGETYTTSLVNYERENVTKCSKCTKSTSRGEIMIKDFLDKNNVEYIFQKTFSGCKDKRLLPFDFYLPEYNAIIEFDGNFHFEPIYGQEQLEYTQRHDKIKNEYCYNNDIPLLRIPYWSSQNMDDIISQWLGLKPIKLIKYPIK